MLTVGKRALHLLKPLLQRLRCGVTVIQTERQFGNLATTKRLDSFKLAWHVKPRRNISILGSLSTRIFKTRTATGSELFSLLTRLHTTTFTLPSIFSPLEIISIKMWETPLSWNAKCSLPVACLSSLFSIPFLYEVHPKLFNSNRKLTASSCFV